MRRLLHLAARLYPAAWRARYGLEFDSLLDDLTPAWREVLDVVRGGLHMQIRRSNVALMAAAFGIVGAIVAGATAFAIPDRFESKGRFRFDHPPKVSEPGRREYGVPELFFTAFSRANLAAVIAKHDLYASERAAAQLRLDVFAQRMRHDVAITRNSDSVFQVSFLHPDPRTAQWVAQDLMTQLSQSAGVLRSEIQVIDPPDLPRVPVYPNRVTMAGAGLGGGTLVGMVVALLRRRSRRSAA